MAGNADVLQGNTASVPITVGSFTDVTTFQFTLTWDSGVLQYASVSSFGLPDFSSANFGYSSSRPGVLTVSWDDPTVAGLTTSDASTLFAVNFTATGTSGLHSAVDFGDTPTPPEVTANIGWTPTAIEFTSAPGSVDVTAVPEPLNLALAVFAGLLIGAKAVARIAVKT